MRNLFIIVLVLLTIILGLVLFFLNQNKNQLKSENNKKQNQSIVNGSRQVNDMENKQVNQNNQEELIRARNIKKVKNIR